MNGTKKDRKFITYNALEIAFRKLKMPNSGSIARLLLECFLEDGGRLQAGKVVARGICEEGKFSFWRDEMVKTGWLVWSPSQADKGHYFAGKKIIPYLNKEKMASKEIVTKDEVLSKNEVATKLEVQVLREEIHQVRNSMEKIYDQLGLGPVDPPGYSKLVNHTDSNKIN